MKKILLFVFSAVLVNGISAQSLVNVDPVTTVPGTLAELGTTGELVAEWPVQNISDNNITVLGSRNVITAVQGSTNYFCWGVCFDEDTNVSPAQAAQYMNAGQVNNSFYAHYKANGNAGQSVIEYCFFDMNNPTDRVCHTVYYCVDVDCVVGVDEQEVAEAEMGEISPNPVTGLGKLSYAFRTAPENAVITIRNLVGQVVREIPVTEKNGLILFSAEDFEAGIYLVSISLNGKVYDTQRLVISR